MTRFRFVFRSVLLLCACGGGKDADTSSETTESSATTSSTTSASTSTTSTSDGSTSDADSTTVANDSSSGGSTSGDAGSSESGPATIPCGDGTCPLGDVCVIPCCGGAEPACYDPDPNMACMGMDALVSPGKCLTPCDNQTACCQPGACVPDPPFCVTEDQLTCNGTDCNYEDCFGYFEMDFLNCTCA